MKRQTRKYGTNPHVSARVKPMVRYHLQKIADGKGITLADVLRDAVNFYLTGTTVLRKRKRVEVVMFVDKVELKKPKRIPFYKEVVRA